MWQFTTLSVYRRAVLDTGFTAIAKTLKVQLLGLLGF